jgi:hypothetical protein
MTNKPFKTADQMQREITKRTQEEALAYDRMIRLRPTADEMERISSRIPTVSQDIRPTEDFSAAGAYRRAFAKVKDQSYEDFRGRFETPTNLIEQRAAYNPLATTQPAEFTPRQLSSITRARRANALRMIASQTPQSLEKYPGLVNALANAEDFDEHDAIRLINLMELDNAFDAYASTEDPVAHENIIASMNPVQRAAFGDYFVEKARALLNEAMEEGSEAEGIARNVGEVFGAALSESFDFLLWLNEQAQQVARATMLSVQETPAMTALAISPGGLLATNAFMYWDQVSPGSYDQEALSRLRAEHGDEKINAILRYHELARDEDPDPWGRWVAEYYGTPLQDFTRRVTDLDADNAEDLRLIEVVNAAHRGNTGMLALSNAPEGMRGSKLYDTAANAINVGYTFGVDPTIAGAKIYGAYRAARYGLIRMSSQAGIDQAFLMKRTQNIFNALGDDFAKLETLDPAKRAVARDVIRRQYGKVIPVEVIDDLERLGMRKAEDAHRWYTSKMISESILEGSISESVKLGNRFIQTYNFDDQGRWVLSSTTPIGAAKVGIPSFNNPRLFDMMSMQQSGKRNPLMPGKSVAGIYRAKMRMAIALHNPTQLRFGKQIRKRYAEAITASAGGSQQLDPAAAARIMGDDVVTIGREQGVRPRGPSLPVMSGDAELGGTPMWGYGYTDRSMSGRLDRLQRKGARAPFPEELYLNNGRDAGKIYEYARSFLTRSDAAFVSDVWRTAPNQAVRKQIISNLAAIHASARGVHFRDGKQALYDYLPEAARGGVYSPSIKVRTADEAGNLSDEAIVMRPSNFDGQEYALHVHQTTDYVAMPNFDVIEKAGVKVGIINSILGAANGRVGQNIVDGWSILNLAGPRYFQRNAIEDYAFYAMTSGNFTNIYKGKRFSTAFRDARGRKLGIVNRRLRSKNKAVTIGDPEVYSKWSLIKAHFTDEDRAAAMIAMQSGDLSKMRSLVAVAMARSKLTGWSKVQEEDLLDFVTEHGAKLIDEASELSRYGVSSMFPYLGVAWKSLRGQQVGFDDAKKFENAVGASQYVKLNQPQKKWGDVSPASENKSNLNAWHSALIAASETDGPIGKIVIANLDKTDDEIIPLIVKAINDDKVYDYAGRFAAITARSPEEFARRYIMDVRNSFSTSKGDLNRELWEKFITIDKNGNRVVQGSRGFGRNERPVVTVDELSKTSKDARPSTILGLTEEVYIPDVTSISGFDRLWSIMGEQYARVSREPIFVANYLEQRKFLRPYEKAMADEFGEQVARKNMSKLATDRAYSLTMSYTDNPRNRTIFAWNTRNVARYYRATEDFIRRTLRVGKNFPEGFWKIALTYDVLEDTGFVWEDEFGEKYFIYPGSDLAIDAMHRTITLLNGDPEREIGEKVSDFVSGSGGLQLDPVSYGLRGNVRMLTPSADLPNSALFNFSSPLSGAGLRTVFALFPSLQRFERALLGEYQEGTDWKALLPGHVLRAWSLIDRDQTYSVFAGAARDAVQIAAAAGALPDRDVATVKEQEDFRRDIDNLTVSMLLLRGITGVVAATPGRQTAINVTDFARKAGVVELSAAFREMVRNVDPDSPNPIAEAATQWVETFGMERSWFTLSKTKGTNEIDSSVEGLSTVSATRDAAEWVEGNMDLVKNHKTAAAWLFPYSGDFDPKFFRFLESAGYRVPKSVTEMIEEASFLNGSFVLRQEMEYVNNILDEKRREYFKIVESGNEELAKEKWAEINEIDARRREARKAIEEDYPELRYRATERDKSREELLNKEIRPMLDYIYNERNRPVEASVEGIDESVSTFDLYYSKISMIEGSSQAAVAARRNLRLELELQLEQISAGNKNVEIFNQRILLPLVNEDYLFPRTQGDDSQ